MTFWAKNTIALLIAFALLPVFVYDVIKMSNRFAGPISRLRVTLTDIADGKDVKPLNFREGDFWNEISVKFNKAFELKNSKQKSEEAVSQKV